MNPRPNSLPPSTAVVATPVEPLFAAASAETPVVTQASLGEIVHIHETSKTGGEPFDLIETEDHYKGWIRAGALVATDGEMYANGAKGTVARVASIRAHVYRDRSFTSAKPIFTVPMGARLQLSDFGDTNSAGSTGSFIKLQLPSGEYGYISENDIYIINPTEKPAPRGPQAWIALGKRLLEIPYTWGGKTPEGFDCSGLIQFLLKQDGILVKRDARQQCFDEPQLRPVPLDPLQPGDLLFFGTESAIDHVAMWIGDGELLESTRRGRPGVKITNFSQTPILQQSLREARRFSITHLS